MDTMLQMQILHEDTRGLFVPTSIQKMLINTKKHNSILQTLDPEKPGLYTSTQAWRARVSLGLNSLDLCLLSSQIGKFILTFLSLVCF